MTKPDYSIVITGEWPGAGQSTTAMLLAQKLHLDRVYAGLLFRKFAHIWKLKKAHLSWDQFESQFTSGQIKLADYAFTEADFNEKTLHEFQLQLKQVKTPELWDKITDTESLRALHRPGVVVEAKVGVLLNKTGLEKSRRLGHKIYKILLVCAPEISAHRIIKRKIQNGELAPLQQSDPRYLELVRQTAAETISRHLRDWERYEKIYGIYRSDIYKPGITKIQTADKSPQKVVDAIIEVLRLSPQPHHPASPVRHKQSPVPSPGKRPLRPTRPRLK